ncbi:MAG TPA: aquaporin [Candidatus Methylomirabilis sp.]|nr:aquaporin [Candidatus Methylomirabilis sp.]
MLKSLRHHWPEYLMEAAGLGSFMLSACIFAVILEYPGSALRQAISDPTIRRVLMGVAMGLTAVGIIYSPWGQQSGAHLNPSVTLTFLRLGKVAPWDAAFYVMAQFLGGLAGVWLAVMVLGHPITQPPIEYVATVPGPDGPSIAFLAEFVISCILMAVVLLASNSGGLARFTGLFAGILVALYIALEAPLSGMSMNPARTVASALPANLWTGLWIYFTAPPVGMLLAAEAYLRLRGAGRVSCAKLHHDNGKRCIFHCGYRKG